MLVHNVINCSFCNFLCEKEASFTAVVKANATARIYIQDSTIKNASNQVKGRCPKSSSNDKKAFNTLAITTFYDEIPVKYSEEKNS